ncbi:PREDICTED: salicylate carboxymethyltransferase-like isoform X2 [Nicotiana attenuata]|uniref:salicylate carboxymethyltransferase-like isoform X2 n=1 Tax=Nicotiana attenuata TaxID=49451 RepID=UPI000905B63F|nr:PREDICTED: salicylate carboxymethyltransferase-like isoform X2 [Nicotiana attenuata]
MEVAKVLHMNEGIGEASYAKNSLLQQKVILMTKSIRDKAICALYRSLSPETICIADLGVAGSFYNRLFPSKSIHFVHSSYSLHWLSQVPDGIENNKGNIYVTSTSPLDVVKAYYEQYERDFVNFLKYRSIELVKGGRMILTMLGRKNEDRYSKACRYYLEPLVMALKELIVEGSIEEEKVNSFNIPGYCPSPAEVKYIVEKEGSFTIDVLETSEIHMDSFDEYNATQCMRASTEPLLVSHFSDELNMDQVYHKCREIFVNGIAKEKTTFTNVIVSLTKIN